MNKRLTGLWALGAVLVAACASLLVLSAPLRLAVLCEGWFGYCSPRSELNITWRGLGSHPFLRTETVILLAAALIGTALMIVAAWRARSIAAWLGMAWVIAGAIASAYLLSKVWLGGQLVSPMASWEVAHWAPLVGLVVGIGVFALAGTRSRHSN